MNLTIAIFRLAFQYLKNIFIQYYHTSGMSMSHFSNRGEFNKFRNEAHSPTRTFLSLFLFPAAKLDHVHMYNQKLLEREHYKRCVPLDLSSHHALCG